MQSRFRIHSARIPTSGGFFAALFASLVDPPNAAFVRSWMPATPALCAHDAHVLSGPRARRTMLAEGDGRLLQSVILRDPEDCGAYAGCNIFSYSWRDAADMSPTLIRH
jgi:hypothetical protein